MHCGWHDRVVHTAGWRRTWAALFALALVVQLLVLYLPDPPTDPGVPGLDKLVHAAVFLAPALLGALVDLHPAWLGGALLAHAVVSELVQQHLLPARAGDPWDALADAIGVALGLGVGWAVRRRGGDERTGTHRH